MLAKTLLSAVAAIAVATMSTTSRSPETKTVRYELDGVTFESTIVHQGDPETPKPGILMVPNWMGPTKESLEKAVRVAGSDYVVMMVDMYGVDTRPANATEAGAAASKLRGDRALMRARARKALEVFRSEGKPLGLDTKRIAAIGFCFGGGVVLELGRDGADLDVITTFHGDLASPTLDADAGKTKAKVLVLHGADDPYVSQDDVQKFIAAMRKTDVDWQLVQYSGTGHSFTNPTADSDGARYVPRTSKRAFAALRALLDETWGGDRKPEPR